MNNDFRVSLTNAPAKKATPSAVQVVFTFPHRQEPGRGSTVAGYLKWVYTSGQKIAQEKGYAILPPEVLAKVAQEPRQSGESVFLEQGTESLVIFRLGEGLSVECVSSSE